MTDQLTIAELQSLINIVAKVVVAVEQVQPYIDLINKLSRMMDEIKAEK
jgi:hypothetical protein